MFKRKIVKVSEGIREQRPRRENNKYEGMDGTWREKNKNINMVDDFNERTGREEKGEYANLSETKVH